MPAKSIKKLADLLRRVSTVPTNDLRTGRNSTAWRFSRMYRPSEIGQISSRTKKESPFGLTYRSGVSETVEPGKFLAMFNGSQMSSRLGRQTFTSSRSANSDTFCCVVLRLSVTKNLPISHMLPDLLKAWQIKANRSMLRRSELITGIAFLKVWRVT